MDPLSYSITGSSFHTAKATHFWRPNCEIVPVRRSPVLRIEGVMWKFDIFRGSSYDDLEWLECVDGLDAAIGRMHEIAARQPGMYFVLNVRERLVVALTDTECGGPPRSL